MMARKTQRRVERYSPPRSGAAEPPASSIGRVIVGTIRLFHGRVRYLAFLAVVTMAIATATLGSTFRVKRTEVYGTLLLDPGTVALTAGLVGENPFLGETAAAEKRVLALGVPRSVTVSYRLPDTAVVDVVERRPAYVWKVDPTLYLVADDGTVLGTTQQENGLVTVVDVDRRAVKPGDKVDARALREAAYLIAALPRMSNLSPPYVLYSHGLGIIVPGPDGIQIAIGDDQDLVAKLQALGPTLKAARAHQPRPSLVDVQDPRHPFFR